MDINKFNDDIISIYEDDESDNSYNQFNYSKKIKTAKLRISNHSKFFKNPSITRFNLSSKFIYDLDEYKAYLSLVKNANYLKPNQVYMDYITELINKINLEKNADRGLLFLKISSEIYNGLINFSNIKSIDSPLITFIKNKFLTETNRNNLSCRKLTNEYYIKTGNKTNRQTVCDIIKNKLGYTYRKTTVKNNKINNEQNILITCAFLKIITRCIKIGFKLIFCDESGFINKNNNYYTWKKKDEQIFFDYEDANKFNLLLAVDEKEVLYYKINEFSTDSKNFLDFIKELNVTLLKKNMIIMF